MKATGAMVKEARKTKGWKQKDLADKMGIDRSNVARIEGSTSVSMDNARKLDKIFQSTAWRDVPSNDALPAIQAATKTLVSMVIEIMTRVDRLEAYAKIKDKPRYTVSSLRAMAQSLPS